MIEVIYFFYFICSLIIAFNVYALSKPGATVSNAESTACDNMSKTSLKKYQSVADCKAAEHSVLNEMSSEGNRELFIAADLGIGFLSFAIVMIITYIPRFYYFIFCLIKWNLENPQDTS